MLVERRDVWLTAQTRERPSGTEKVGGRVGKLPRSDTIEKARFVLHNPRVARRLAGKRTFEGPVVDVPIRAWAPDVQTYI